MDELGRRIQSQKKLNSTRRYIGELMTQSLRDYPQASPYFEFEVDELLKLKDELKAQNKNVTITSLFVRLMATVLEEYPLLNSAVVNGELVTYASCNVGVGVGLERGIMTVVIKEISDHLKEKTTRIKTGELPMEDMMGSTFTISSIGVQGIRYSTVILNPPETGMLAIGVTEKRPVVLDDDSIAIRRITGFGLTHNHTIIDGFHVGAIIDLMRERMRNPRAYMGL